MDTSTELTPKQIIALNALMQGDTQSAAAKKAKVSLDAVQYWIYRVPAFRAAYDQQRRALLAEVEHKAPETLAKAATLLAEIFEYGEQPDENRRPDLALALLKAVFSKASVVNVLNAYADNSQSLTVNNNSAAPPPPLDARQLDPGAIGSFVEALRSATITVEAKQVGTNSERKDLQG